MSHKLALQMMLCIIIIVSVLDQLFAQDREGEVIIISQRVGEMIDRGERNYYQLFPDIEGFQSAIFTHLPNNTYELKITYHRDNAVRMRFLKLSESEIKEIRKSIDHFEEIQIGIYESKVYKLTPQVEPAVIYDTPSSLNPLKIFWEVLLGSAGSMGIGLLGLDHGFDNSGGNWRTAGLGFLIGSTIGSSLGVYLIGCWGDETGDLLDTYLGSVVGTALSVGFIFVSSSAEVDIDIKDYYLYIVPAQTVGAVIAFNKTRRLELVRPGNALLYYNDNNWSFSYPRIYIKQNPLRKGDWIQTINLVTLEF
jgi:hypothetical protein